MNALRIPTGKKELYFMENYGRGGLPPMPSKADKEIIWSEITSARD